VKPSETFDWKILFERTVDSLKKTDHPLEMISRNKKENAIRDLLVGHMLATESPQVILSESLYAKISVPNDSGPDIGDNTRLDIMHFGNEFTLKTINNPKFYLELKAGYCYDYEPAPGRNLEKPWAEISKPGDALKFFNDTRRLLEFKENHPDTVCIQGLVVFYNVISIYEDKRTGKRQDPKFRTPIFSDAFAETFKEDGLRQAMLSNALTKLKEKEGKDKSKGKKSPKLSKDLKYSLNTLYEAPLRVIDSINFLLTEKEFEEKYWIKLYLFELDLKL
jgi:hypothetical protein